MSTPSITRCTLDVEFVREIRPDERVRSWVERVEDFEPPLQGQTQSPRPSTPTRPGHHTVSPPPDPESPEQHETRSVVLSRSRYSQSRGGAESEHGQENKSTVTLSRSHVLSSPPRTPKRPASPLVVEKANNSSVSKPPTSPSPTTPSKRAKGRRGKSKTPTRLVPREPDPQEDDSPLGAPRNFIPSPQSQRSRSPSYSQPPSPSLPRGYVIKRPVVSPIRAPSRQSVSRHGSMYPPTDIENEYRDGGGDEFEDDLEVMREQEEQEQQKKLRFNLPHTVKHKPNHNEGVHIKEEEQDNLAFNEEYIDDELEAIAIKEQEEEQEGKIILVERTDEEYRQLQPKPESPSPEPLPGSFTSLFEIWSRALEEYHIQNTRNSRKSPTQRSVTLPQGSISATDLLTQIEALEKRGVHLSPSFPWDGPPCQNCGQASTFRRVGAQNSNGNAHRPFYKCHSCDKFVTWADLRGVFGGSEGNPQCDCGEEGKNGVVVTISRLPSRMNVTGKKALSGPGKIFYTCAEARCGFWEWG